MLRRLVYTSRASSEISEQMLFSILLQARERNRAQQVTGLLLYKDNEFLQLLEGPPEQVQDIYASISRDPRHTDLHILVDEHVPIRMFADWQMGVAQVTDQTLRTHPGYSVFLDQRFAGCTVAHRDEVMRLLMAFRDKPDLGDAAA